MSRKFMNSVRKIISGGQTGVDHAALRAALDCGLEIGGWCPPGRRCETGVIPLEFPLQETEIERSPKAPNVPRSQRTEWNVRDSDATLVLVRGTRSGSTAVSDRGTEWTIECAKARERPLLVCDLDDPNANEMIREWLTANLIETLNVAGPSESVAPGIGKRAYESLRAVFERL